MGRRVISKPNQVIFDFERSLPKKMYRGGDINCLRILVQSLTWLGYRLHLIVRSKILKNLSPKYGFLAKEEMIKHGDGYHKKA